MALLPIKKHSNSLFKRKKLLNILLQFNSFSSSITIERILRYVVHVVRRPTDFTLRQSHHLRCSLVLPSLQFHMKLSTTIGLHWLRKLQKKKNTITTKEKGTFVWCWWFHFYVFIPGTSECAEPELPPKMVIKSHQFCHFCMRAKGRTDNAVEW